MLLKRFSMVGPLSSAARIPLSVTIAAFGLLEAGADCSNGGSRTELTL